MCVTLVNNEATLSNTWKERNRFESSATTRLAWLILHSSLFCTEFRVLDKSKAQTWQVSIYIFLCFSNVAHYMHEWSNKHRIIFSGIQPTSIPHIGNYFGAIKKWVDMQNQRAPNDHPLIISKVDLHALTLPKDPKILK